MDESTTESARTLTTLADADRVIAIAYGFAVNPPNEVRIRINRVGLEFNRDYGVDHRTGWSAVLDGHFVAQLVPLEEADAALRRAVRHG